MTNKTPLDILNQLFGYESFRHHQAEIIQNLIDGNDVLTLMPTGGGKSLCYQIPAILRQGTGIVISPLIALMQDQVNALRQLNINAAFINSSLTTHEVQAIEQGLINDEYALLYIAPERLLTQRTFHLLKKTRIALFAIDEAHCVSQWGHDFRKEYQKLSILCEHFPTVPRIALTATADQLTRTEIINQLNLQQASIFVNSFDRKNIRYTISEGHNSRDLLWRFLQKEHPADAGIVYCLSRNKVDMIAQWLCSKGRLALPYHAGLSAEERKQNQDRFLREENIIIVATIAFGMGIDKPDVRFVAHLNLPKSIEAYYQETGRAGRDGEPANAWMSYGLQDVILLRQMLNSADAHEQYIRLSNQKLDAMLGLCEMTSCRRQALLAYFDETLDQPCGNCDNCLSPPDTLDGSVVAQKALSTVYRSGQRFGTGYLIDLLQGKKTERILNNQHDKLSVFGIGTEFNASEWRRLFRQLIAQRYLNVDPEGHGSIKLTEKCRGILRGKEKIQIHKPGTQEVNPQQVKKTAKQRELQAWDLSLFDALRELRLTLSEEQNVPPFVIFHDTTLQHMAQIRPTTENELRYIHGVGEQKLKRYGKKFLDVIAKHRLPELLNNNLTDTVKQTLFYYQQGKSISEIAEQRELKTSTIYS
ncbi:MAG TPA: DNA helicase RecQ, partial [Gammaproteobacteria bacterium]|nr:DNA helicase RecQ [Gammaproteobacteria bacterium]